jgi:hypothetical protein
MSATILTPSVAWRPSVAQDYDPHYYQAFVASIGRVVVNARVYVELGAAAFSVDRHDPSGWRSFRLRAPDCSCAEPSCEHRELVRIAQGSGLRLHTVLDGDDFLVTVRSDYVELRAARAWPPEVGPRLARVYPSTGKSIVRLHDTGEHALYALDTTMCSCLREPPCLHQQLLGLATMHSRA